MRIRYLLLVVALAMMSGCQKKVVDADGDGYPDCRQTDRGWPRYADPEDCRENTSLWVYDSGLDAEVNYYPYGDWNVDLHDCDDTDPEVHPDAVEICDFKDNDCDGRFEEWDGEEDVDPLDLDCDGDGYVTLQDRDDPEGDCDPWDAAVYPGAEELCDGRDNDCNGVVDDVRGDDCLEEDPAIAGTLTGCRCSAVSNNAYSWFAMLFTLLVAARRRPPYKA